LSPFVISLIGIGAFLLLVILRLPIAFAFAIVGFVGVLLLKGVGQGLSVLGIAPYTWASDYVLIAVPLFVLMGQFAFHSGISSDLYAAGYRWLGRLPGGLALATTLASTGFAACTGSSLASAATMGTIAYPEMKRFNYSPRLSTGCIAAGGTLGILIPPSVIFIIYGVLTGTSIGKLFIAGIFPGLMLSGLFLILILMMCKRNPQLGPRGMSFPWRDRFTSLIGVWGMIALFLIVIGGLYIGIFTPSEAGAIGAFGAFLIALSKRRLTKSALIASLRDSLRITCMALTILIGAMIFSVFLVATDTPAKLAELIVRLPLPSYVILVMILALYIPLGMLMDALPMILLTLPLVFPVIESLGFDPIWFGVLLVIMCEMALISPPVGMNVYIVQGVTKAPLEEVFRGALPFLLVMIVGVAILVAFPQISLFLPGMMK
jgi:tripartite ATP-independent transporter DctM subunit